MRVARQSRFHRILGGTSHFGHPPRRLRRHPPEGAPLAARLSRFRGGLGKIPARLVAFLLRGFLFFCSCGGGELGRRAALMSFDGQTPTSKTRLLTQAR